MTTPLENPREIPTPPTLTDSPDSRQTVLQYVLSAGTQAPSWYNCQPWRFRVENDQIDVILNREADTSFYNWNNGLSIMACGAAAENICIAASGRGLSPQMTAFPEGASSPLVARIHLDWSNHPDNVNDADSLEPFIWRRHTNTLDFSNTPLSSAEQQALFDALEPQAGVSLHLLHNDDEKNKAYLAASRAEQVRFSRAELHRYLHRMIRWSQADATADRTGLTLPAMGACGVGETFFRVTRTWPVMRFMNLLGASKSQGSRACMGLLHCSAVGLLSVKKGDNQALLAAGQQMQRVWLTATSLGLDLQPHTTLTLFHWAWRFGGPTLYSQQERQVLEDAFQRYTEAFPDVALHDGETGVFLFRVGKGPPVRGFTLRKNLSDVIQSPP